MRAALVVACLLAFTSIAGAESPKPRAPRTLVLVIDRSGSMQGAKLDAAKLAVDSAVGTLQAGDQVAVVAFDSEAQVFLRPQSASNRARITKEIARLTSGGGTNILAGIKEASEILHDLKAGTKHVILLSDGQSPSDGISDLVKQMRKDQITISTIAVDGADEVLLKQISVEGAGRMYKVTDLGQLSQTFVKETKLALK